MDLSPLPDHNIGNRATATSKDNAPITDKTEPQAGQSRDAGGAANHSTVNEGARAGGVRAEGVSVTAEGVKALVLVPVLSTCAKRAVVHSGGTTTTHPEQQPIHHDPMERLREATGLAAAIDLNVVEALTVSLPNPRPAMLFGSGKVAEMGELVEANDIELVIVDHSVTPIQQSNLEKAWNCKVLDRTGLILEIFGKRARTKEGVLQVELAHLSYQKGRLVRSWTHLERQRGGAGFLGGPGERQIELDRRMIQERIDAIKKDLEIVVKTRELHRAGRRRVPYPVVALVGYTNAGKSTLFNLTTGAAVFAKDQVFATLDPTMREIILASKRRIILSDTVGFISDLPTMLVAAFRATLEEVVEADLIVHVRDISHPQALAQRADVNKVLAALGLDPHSADTNLIEVWNKVDLLDAGAREDLQNTVERMEAGQRPVLVSAITGEGVEGLLARLEVRLGAKDELVSLAVPSTNGALVNWLYENCEVLDRQQSSDHSETTYNLRLSAQNKGRLEAQLQGSGIYLRQA